MGLIGKTVKIRCGPATVNGDENHVFHCPAYCGMGRNWPVDRSMSQETCQSGYLGCLRGTGFPGFMYGITTPCALGIQGFFMDITGLLDEIPIFKNIPKKEIGFICQTFRLSNFKEGQQIIKEGDLIREVGLVSAGKLTVMMAVNNDLVECGSLGKGDFIGSGSLMVGNSSIVNVYCKTHVKCYMQPRRDFIDMLNKYPLVKEFFYRSALTSILRSFEKVNGSSSVSNKTMGIKDETAFFPRVIRKALVYIEKNFMNPLSLDEVAQVNAMSRYHFSRIFKLKTGFSFKDYINAKRIQRAKYLMENEDMNITEAAFAVGYNDLSYFSRIFQKQEGLSPSKYKKSFQSRPKKIRRRLG